MKAGPGLIKRREGLEAVTCTPFFITESSIRVLLIIASLIKRRSGYGVARRRIWYTVDDLVRKALSASGAASGGCLDDSVH
jgi:hypothetical protein